MEEALEGLDKWFHQVNAICSQGRGSSQAHAVRGALHDPLVHYMMVPRTHRSDRFLICYLASLWAHGPPVLCWVPHLRGHQPGLLMGLPAGPGGRRTSTQLPPEGKALTLKQWC